MPTIELSGWQALIGLTIIFVVPTLINRLVPEKKLKELHETVTQNNGGSTMKDKIDKIDKDNEEIMKDNARIITRLVKLENHAKKNEDRNDEQDS